MTSDTTARLPLVEPLPEGVRLFHIGPAKTGTTSLQAAAAATRPQLLAHGVLYPGQARSQRDAVAAFLGRSLQYNRARPGEALAAPSLEPWTRMLAEVSAHPGRAWFGHEYAAGATPAQVAGFAEAIGAGLHVAVTLRSFTRMLPSIWQEYNKAGNTTSFDGFVKRMFAVEPERRAEVKFHIRHDHAALVRRWAEAVGVPNVTVVIADRRDHSFTMNAFEDLLGLPRDLLASAEIPPRASNRTMSAAEIEFVRQVNKRLREVGLPWADYEALMVKGGLSRMLSRRRPAPGEPGLKLSKWAAARAEEYQQEIVEGLRASGVRLVGDLANLQEPARPRTSGLENHLHVESVPLDAAVEAAVGIIAAATGHTPDFEPRGTATTGSERRQHARAALDHLRAAAGAAAASITGRTPR